MTTLGLRVEGATKTVDKLTKKIARLEGLIVKKQAKIDSGKGSPTGNGGYWETYEIKNHQDDIKSAVKDLAKAKEKLNEYLVKFTAETKERAEVPMVESVEAFLEDWRVKAVAFYTEQMLEYKEYLKNEDKAVNYKVRLEARNKKYNQMIQMYASYPNTQAIAKIEKDMANEVISKRIDLYKRCSEIVGIITDASGLRTGNNGSINGFVIGEKGRAYVETIYAGGYNIQVLHYRVLVKAVK